MTSCAPAGTIDLRPLFAPRSIAVVGASPRSWIAETVRDNLRVTGSATRCHFVNPRYDELHGQPCYPSLDALPERPDIALVALNPLRAAIVTRDAAAAGIPAVIIPGGGVVEGGEAAATMQREVAEIAREHGLALVGPNCMGVMDLTVNSSAYIGDVSPYLPRGGVAGIAQSGSVTDAFIQSGSRVGFTQDHQLRDRGRPRRLRLPGVLPGRPRDDLGHPVPRGVQAAGALPRPGRSGARAGQADHGGQGRSERPGAGIGGRPFRLAGRRDAGHRCRPRRRRRHPLRRPGRAARDRRARRGDPPDGPIGRSRADRRRHRQHRRGVARRRPRAADRARPAAAARDAPARGSSSTCRRWATSGTRWIRGVRPTRRRPTAPCFESMAASDAYDVLVLVHDFPYKSMPAEVATANDVTLPAPRGDPRPAAHPAGLRVADVRGAAAGDEGRAGRAGRRGAAAARRARGVQCDRVGRALGGVRGRAGSTGGHGGRLAGAGRGPDGVRARPDGVGCRSGRRVDRAALRALPGAREPGAAASRRPDRDRGSDRGAGRRGRRRGRASRSAGDPSPSSSTRSTCRTRATSASSGSGSSATTAVRGRRRRPAGDRPRPRAGRPRACSSSRWRTPASS